MTRGRPKQPLLNQADIVTEALRIAEGGREPSLGSIATALGVHVSSLYNHVESKAHLINLIRRRIAAMHPPEPLPVDDWAESLRVVARRMRAVLLAYPALLSSFAATPLDPSLEVEQVPQLHAVMQSAGFTTPTIGLVLDFIDFVTLGSALDLTYEVPTIDNDETFEFGLDRFIAGLEPLLGRA